MMFLCCEGSFDSCIGRYSDFWLQAYRLAFPGLNRVAIEVSYPVTEATLSPTFTAFPMPTHVTSVCVRGKACWGQTIRWSWAVFPNSRAVGRELLSRAKSSAAQSAMPELGLP